jgi:MazG family protein
MPNPTSFEKQKDTVPRSAAQSLLNLLDVMTRLRSESGCEWDRTQSLASLRPYLLEETYEVLEVLDAIVHQSTDRQTRDRHSEQHCQELGDLLLQIVFQAEIQREAELFHFGDVADAVRNKLERRHPHLFGDDQDRAAGRIAWEKVKEKERALATGSSRGALDGVPKHLPALLRALRVGEKAHGVGFDWPDHRGVVDKIEEELDEVKEAISSGNKKELAHEIGDLLYAIVNLCRHFSLDPEASLRSTISRFEARFRWVEAALAQDGKTAGDRPLEELESMWEQAKKALEKES